MYQNQIWNLKLFFKQNFLLNKVPGPGPQGKLLVWGAVAVEDLHVVQDVLQASGLDRLVLQDRKYSLCRIIHAVCWV